jgi:hypothetical protein
MATFLLDGHQSDQQLAGGMVTVDAGSNLWSRGVQTRSASGINVPYSDRHLIRVA